MQNNCEIYVDPEEDEVFFGCMSEREKNISGKLAKYTGSSPKNDYKLNKILDEYIILNDEENIENIPNNEQSTKISKEIFKNDTTDLVLTHDEPNNSPEKDHNMSRILSDNTSVELEHNYSTAMKQKIDKSILATPKSIVKADRDGGFLKVLSEIALVKAEVEGDNIEAAKENEDKENKMIYSIPIIKITEATPDKGISLSPPKSAKAELRRFRNIHNSPRKENNINHKSKSVVESFESEKNFKNRCLNQDIDKKVLSDGNKRKSVDLIDLNDFESDVLNVSILLDEEEFESHPDKANENDKIILPEQKQVCEIIMVSDSFKPVVDEKPDVILEPSSKAEPQPLKAPNSSKNLRFSKEAKKIVEVLKKSVADDTLNFTIPEMNIEEEENSFLSPELPLGFNETVIPMNNVEILPEKSSPEILTKPAVNKLAMKSKTVEKYQHKLTPVVSLSKLQSMKYFSERRIFHQNESEMKKKCVKRLPMEEKKPITAEKIKGGRICESNAIMPSSRIPVFGLKNSKIPANERVTRPLTTTTAKTPSGKGYKNSKFNHIESPINAYIHSKPTSLVCNIKPEIKKDNIAKVWKAQTIETVSRIQQKGRQQNPNSDVKLPFVEYKSATPYKIEKRPESRLPRLAPTVLKIIGSHSPKVLKHEGRFYMNKPKNQNSAEATIIAEQNEVSLVLSQPAQKKKREQTWRKVLIN